MLKIDSYISQINIYSSNSNSSRKKYSNDQKIFKYNKLKKLNNINFNSNNTTLSLYTKRQNSNVINNSYKNIISKLTLNKNKSMSDMFQTRNNINYFIINYLNNNINHYSNDNNFNYIKSKCFKKNKNINSSNCKLRKPMIYNVLKNILDNNKIKDKDYNNLKTYSSILNNTTIKNNNNKNEITISNIINDYNFKKEKKSQNIYIKNNNKNNPNINFYVGNTNDNIINNNNKSKNINFFNSISTKHEEKTKKEKLKNIIMTPNKNKEINQHHISHKTLKDKKNNLIKIMNSKTKKIKQYMKWNIKDYFVLKSKKLEKNSVSNKKRINNKYKSKSISVDGNST